MKRLCIFTLLFCVFTLNLSAQELVKNPGFELTDGWGKGNTFNTPPDGPEKAEITEIDKKSGNKSFRFYRESVKGGSQVFSEMQKLDIAGSTKASIDFSYFYKGSPMLVFVRFYGADRKPLKNDLGQEIKVTLNTAKSANAWTEFKKNIPIPQAFLNTDLYFDLQFQLWGKGEVFFDDVSVKLNTDKVPSNAPEQKTASKDDLSFLIIKDPPSNSTLPPLGQLPYKYGEKEGYLTKNGSAHFYTGNSSFGGGQYSPHGIWLARFLNYSMVTLDWGFHHDTKKEGDKLVVSFRNPESSVSMWREMTRNGLIVEHDTGNAMDIYMPERRWLKEFPALGQVFTEGSHFYSYDHNTELGRRFHSNTWLNRYRFMKGFPVMATEIYNELGYTPSHERVLKGFREFAKQKYGSLDEACKVWNQKFESWDTVRPPHLSTDIFSGGQAHGYRMEMKQKYWQLYYDWLRYLQLDLMAGLKLMKEDFRKISDTPITVDWRGHNIYSDGYCILDPDMLDEIVDIFGLHTGASSYDFKNSPADQDSVLTAITHDIMHYQFAASNTKKPIINPECIISRTSTSGSSLESMKANSFKNFLSDWQFKHENDSSGIEKGYFKSELDDSAWDKMKVPGCWDETDKYRDKKGWGWYRNTFTVPAILKNDYEDGSRKFCIYGRGIAQKGTFWINGVKVGEAKGWDSTYKFDVSPYLKYGQENQVTILVDGSNYANGLRFYFFILPEDCINTTRLLEKKEYQSMLWNMMMNGCSGVVLWHWDDAWRPFMAEVNQELDAVSAIAMPQARNRTFKAAMLMPYLWFRGLPTQLEKNHIDYMRYYGAMFFNQVPPALLTEGNILKATPEQYPLILYPYAHVVQPETFRHFKSYVEAGGTALVTFDSLDLNYTRYSDSGLNGYLGIKVTGDYTGKDEISFGGETLAIKAGNMIQKVGVKIEAAGAEVLGTYADNSPAIVKIKRGKGSVIYMAANPDLFAAHKILGSLIKTLKISPRAEILDSGDKSEFPYIEAQFTGDEKRFLLYVHNHGGKNRNVKVKLPYAGTYNVRNTITMDGKTEKAEGSFTLSVAGTAPACYVFEKASVTPMPLKKIAEGKTKILERMRKFEKNPADINSPKPKILFIEPKAQIMGRTGFPNFADMVEAWWRGVGALI